MNWFDSVMAAIASIWIVWLMIVYGVMFPYMAFKIWDKLYQEED